ncbi:MAG: hypothetical protein CVU39_01510 [Chloroflexi bacterium HGW-Chloroflexi-10]|nr:MAG: hypothetical protein CVU39_01510 [Chloroflexi bacterium HGW-Chloroflexi-10]
MTKISTLLKTYRVKSGLTQKQLASRMNFNHTVISRIENQENGYLPTIAYVQKFCNALELAEDDRLIIQAAYEKALMEHKQQEISEQNQPTEDLISTLLQKQSTNIPAFSKKKIPLGSLLISIMLLLFSVWYYLQLSGKTEKKNLVSNFSPGTLLYAENFEDHSTEGWENLNIGQWEIMDRNGNSALAIQPPNPEAVPNAFLTQSLTWKDYVMDVDVVFRSGSFEQVYLVVRNAGRENNCTGYRIGGNRLGVAIFRFDPKDQCLGETLAENSNFSLVDGNTYHMRVEVVGELIRYYINDELVLEASDSTYPQGGIGLLGYQVQWVTFDNIFVKSR